MDESIMGLAGAIAIITSICGLIAVKPPQAPSGVLAPPPVSHRMDESYNPRSNAELCEELRRFHMSDPSMGLIEQAVRAVRCQVLLPPTK